MKLSSYAVVHERGEGSPMFDNPLVHCFAGSKIVLAYIDRQALMDYFEIPGERRLSLRDWNLVVDRNLDSFKSIIESKFDRDEWEFYSAHGENYPRIVVTFEDMKRSGQQFTISVLDLDAGFRSIR
jgi:hypothetical protein